MPIFLKCPHCGTEIEGTVHVCRGCGAEVLRGATCGERSGCGCCTAIATTILFAFFAKDLIGLLEVQVPPDSPPPSILAIFVIMPAWIIGAIIAGFAYGGTRFVRRYRHRD